MHGVNELVLPGRETQFYGRLLYACQALAALLLAGWVGSLPGMIAVAAIGGTALALMIVQHFITRRLGTRTSA